MNNNILPLNMETAMTAFGKIGLIFTVEFKKRSNGENRIMNCRFGVHSNSKGNPIYDPFEKGLFIVYDVHKKQFRSIPLEGIQKIKSQGHCYEIINNKGTYMLHQQH